jgi:hypothetical protein
MDGVERSETVVKDPAASVGENNEKAGDSGWGIIRF